VCFRWAYPIKPAGFFLGMCPCVSTVLVTDQRTQQQQQSSTNNVSKTPAPTCNDNALISSAQCIRYTHTHTNTQQLTHDAETRIRIGVWTGQMQLSCQFYLPYTYSKRTKAILNGTEMREIEIMPKRRKTKKKL